MVRNRNALSRGFQKRIHLVVGVLVTVAVQPATAPRRGVTGGAVVYICYKDADRAEVPKENR